MPLLWLCLSGSPLFVFFLPLAALMHVLPTTCWPVQVISAHLPNDHLLFATVEAGDAAVAAEDLPPQAKPQAPVVVGQQDEGAVAAAPTTAGAAASFAAVASLRPQSREVGAAIPSPPPGKAFKARQLTLRMMARNHTSAIHPCACGEHTSPLAILLFLLLPPSSSSQTLPPPKPPAHLSSLSLSLPSQHTGRTPVCSAPICAWRRAA